MQFISLIIYNISIRLYGVGIYFVLLFNQKAKLWIEGRKKSIPELQVRLHKKRIWVHCASLGEFEQARPVIERIKEDKPDTFIILTFFSPSGYEIRKDYKYADLVLYLPLDTAFNAKDFINRIKPDLVLFVKYEFWYHYLHELNTRQIPVVLFSAIFRSEQIFFKWYGAFFKSILQNFSKIFVQNQESQNLLKGIGIASEICFDTRFDRVAQIAKSGKVFPLVEKFKGSYKVLIAGSTWKKDEEIVTALINSAQYNDFKFIIAPHNLSDQAIQQIKNNLSLPALQITQLTETNAEEARVIIVDTMGDLSALYRYADIAYVGGGFNASVHNVLEPAVYGIPVIYGPNHLKSAEAIDLVNTGAGFSVIDGNSLLTVINKLNDKSNLTAAGNKCLKYVKERLGGVTMILNYLNQSNLI